MAGLGLPSTKKIVTIAVITLLMMFVINKVPAIKKLIGE